MELPRQCPHCGYVFDDAAAVFGPEDQLPTERPHPRDGSLGLCIKCGSWLFYTARGTRKPTAEEWDGIVEDPRVQKITAAWRKMTRGQRR